MPTPFYLTNTPSVVDYVGKGDPHEIAGTTTMTELLASLTPGSSLTSITDATLSASAGVFIAAPGATNAINNGARVWFSNPINAVTIADASGQVDLWALESNAMANYGIGYKVVRVSGSGAYISTVVANIAIGGECGTASTDFFSGQTVTSTAFADGDRIGIVVWWRAAGGTSASGFTASFRYNAATQFADGCSFVSFGETITEQVAATGIPDRSRTHRPRVAPHIAMRCVVDAWSKRPSGMFVPRLWTPADRQGIISV